MVVPRSAPAATAASAAQADQDPFSSTEAKTRCGNGNAADANRSSSSSPRRPLSAARRQQQSPLALFAERLDWALVVPFFACAGLLGFYILNDVQPFDRTVSLADRTVAMPVVPKTNTMPAYVAPFVPAMVLIGVAAAAEFLPLIPSMRARVAERAPGRVRPPVPALAAAALVRAVGGMLVALCATACMTEFLKVFCGRPRPDFMTRCAPRVPPATAVNAGALLDGLVLGAGAPGPGGGPLVPFECTGADRAAIAEARKSFPSGHSSSATSVGLWGALYVLHSLRRLGGRGGGSVPSSPASSGSFFLPRLLRELGTSVALLVVLFFLAWPWGVGATRFVDNRHHPSDIVGGILLGAFMTLPFFMRFASVTSAWDERDARELVAVDAGGDWGDAAAGGAGEEAGVVRGGGAAIAPAVATQV